jgi:hypothetical protein
MNLSPWEEMEPDVFRLRNSCNVYAVRGPDFCFLANTNTATCNQPIFRGSAVVG